LLVESIDGLDIKPDGIYVDVTFGGGGHSREILSRLGPNGKLYALDQMRLLTITASMIRVLFLLEEIFAISGIS